MSDFFQCEQNRNFVTERVTNPVRNQQIIKLQRKFINKNLKPFEAIYIDKYIPVNNICPCPTFSERIRAISEFNDRLYDKPNSRPIRLI